MKLLLLLVVMGTVSAKVQDLSGKMFIFPQRTDTAHVRLNPYTHGYNALTVCHRSFTDINRDHVLFSLATPSDANSFLIFWDDRKREIQPHIRGARVAYGGWDNKLNTWHSICTTWDSVTGPVQVWFDGTPSIRKFTFPGEAIDGTAIAILGQEQDLDGGGFDINQSFVGMITDVHMWDFILSSCEIHEYMEEKHYPTGNVLNWHALDFEITGNVQIEDKVQICR